MSIVCSNVCFLYFGFMIKHLYDEKECIPISIICKGTNFSVTIVLSYRKYFCACLAYKKILLIRGGGLRPPQQAAMLLF